MKKREKRPTTTVQARILLPQRQRRMKKDGEVAPCSR
jgi:hypothetical protein